MTSAAMVARPFLGVRRIVRSSGWVLIPLAVAALVSIPIAVVVSQLLVPSGGVMAHLASTVLGRYVANTLWLIGGVGIGVLAMGISTAWLCSMCVFPGRRLFEWALLLPLAVPTYAIGLTYAGLLEYAGPVQSALRAGFGWQRADYWFPDIRSLGGVVVVMSLVLYPYVYLLARAAFINQSVCVLEIGRTLGRGPWYVFLRVAVPLARPAIVGGAALALMEALSDFGTVQYYGVDTFTTGIFRTWFNLHSAVAAAQLSAMLLGFVVILLLVEQWSRGGARFHHTTGRYRPLPRYALRGWSAVGAVALCGMPLVLGFLVPAGQLAIWSIKTGASMVDGRFFSYVQHSFVLALVSALVAVTVALVVCYAVRLSRSLLAASAGRLAGLGYAMPGSVIAVGVLMPFAWLDHAVDGLAQAWFGVSTGLLLTGGIAALVFAYVVRFLALSMNAVSAGLAKVTPSMDDAARSLGAGPGRILLRVHAPIVAGSLLTAGLLVFVDVMKELPATLIMRPFNFDTLAVRAYELASDERLADSGSAALAIVAVGLIPVLVLSRSVTRARPGAALEGGYERA